MTTFDVIAACFAIVGFFAVLFGLVLIIDAIVRDALAGWNTERDLRNTRHQSHLNGAPEFFRPRYARNHRR